MGILVEPLEILVTAIEGALEFGGGLVEPSIEGEGAREVVSDLGIVGSHLREPMVDAKPVVDPAALDIAFGEQLQDVMVLWVAPKQALIEPDDGIEFGLLPPSQGALSLFRHSWFQSPG